MFPRPYAPAHIHRAGGVEALYICKALGAFKGRCRGVGALLAHLV